MSRRRTRKMTLFLIIRAAQINETCLPLAHSSPFSYAPLFSSLPPLLACSSTEVWSKEADKIQRLFGVGQLSPTLFVLLPDKEAEREGRERARERDRLTVGESECERQRQTGWQWEAFSWANNSHMAVFINALSLANTHRLAQFVGFCNYAHIIKLT